MYYTFHSFNEKLCGEEILYCATKIGLQLQFFIDLIETFLLHFHVDKLFSYQDITVGPNDLIHVPYTKFLK